MKTVIVEFDEKEAAAAAQKAFDQIVGLGDGAGGFDLQPEKDDEADAERFAAMNEGSKRRLRVYAQEAHERCSRRIALKAAYRFDEGRYFYALTAGEGSAAESDDVMAAFMEDAWATAYVNAGMELLREKIAEDLAERFPGDGEVVLSEAFGPGYFGESIEKTGEYLAAAGGGEIGITNLEGGAMIPEKSCTGMYIATRDPEIGSGPGCLKCAGNPAGCAYCSIRNK